MRRLPTLPRFTAIAVVSLVTLLLDAVAPAAEVIQLSESKWDGVVPRGKEVDCIYGDWLLQNDHLVAVIAEALPTRNANMTVRGVGGSLIDLTEKDRQSDQLSAYYPLGARYALEGPVRQEHGKSASLTFAGAAHDGKSKAEVTYALDDEARWLRITTRVTNTSDQPLELTHADSIRADGEFQFGEDAGLGLFWAYDSHWRQAYGTMAEDDRWSFTAGEKQRRGSPALLLEHDDGPPPKLAPGETSQLVRYVFSAADTLGVLATAHELRGNPLVKLSVKVSDPDGPIDGADIEVSSDSGEISAHGKTNAKGQLLARLPAGKYKAVVSAQGRGETTLDLGANDDVARQAQLPAPGYVAAKITGADGEPIACKVQFRGTDGTPSPNFGPDSAIHGVQNLYYTEDGKFRIPLAAGQYDVIVSHGPEFDAVSTTLEVRRGEESPLSAELVRTVDTSGWLSADFHSHSSPSGDNTASQRGRVLNLLAEHVEFAPCTEHNRLTVYDPHLAHFKAARRMLTCCGIELTGRPGSVNHQNAFPLENHPHTQDGGAPLTDEDPVVQIERLAMWDNGSDKLVQTNHPYLVQIVGDRDLDGSPDGGFEKMFSFMDVMEIHPLDRIFEKPESLPSARERGNTIFHWLQLLNLGYRVPGVVNTDAHWNFHGSGGLRNFVKSATDDPSAGSVPDLVHACEHGNIVMSNGPFMEVRAEANVPDQVAEVGEDLDALDGKVKIKVRVQCPNWLEVNRVQVFVNGEPKPELNLTQRTHPAKFHRDTVVFDETIELQLDSDAHLVVACAGEGKTHGDVMGPRGAKKMPVAVGNPIFVDVDGDGFEPNGDLLGLPLPLEPGFKPSKPHEHRH